MRVSHLVEIDAGQPGITSRNGKPCSSGSGSPLIAQAIMLLSSSSFLIGTPRDIVGFLLLPETRGSAP